MDHLAKRQIVATAFELWQHGQEIAAGKMIYERIARKDRPAWAADILQIAYRSIPITPEVGAIITFACLPQDWHCADATHRQRAHQLFENVREIFIHQGPHTRLTECIFSLAENVAKVTYNAYGFLAPFDHDAGWWIAPCSKAIIEEVGEETLSDQLWRAFANEDYLTLQSPTRCNPYCETCSGWLSFDAISCASCP